jgi:hypothetical protein
LRFVTVRRRLPSSVNTTFAMPVPRTPAVNARLTQPEAAIRRAVGFAMRSPSTICPPAGADGCCTAARFTAVHASPTPFWSVSSWPAFIADGQLSQASTLPSPSLSGSPAWSSSQLGVRAVVSQASPMPS